jgi:hypothetical protein
MAVVALVAGCTGTSDPTTVATDLPDGFEVPAGTRVIGAVIPTLAPAIGPEDPDRNPAHGWQAVLRTRGHPRKIYEAFRAQARAVGLPPLPPRSSACVLEGGPWRCSGGNSTPKRDVRVTVSNSSAWLSYRAVGSPAETTTRDIARTGRPFPLNYRWWRVPGTRSLIQTETLACNGSLEVLEVTGDREAVWETLTRRAAWVEDHTERRATVAGTDVRELSLGGVDYSITITLVAGTRHARPIIAFDGCS